VQAVEAVLAHVWRIHATKALDPMDDADFLVISKRLADALKGATRETETDAIKRAIASLDVDWRALSSLERERIVRASRAALKQVPDKVIPRVEETLRASANRTIDGVKQKVSRDFGYAVSYDQNARDARIAERAAKSQGNFIRNEYGKREEAFSQRARQIVAEGLDAGHGRHEIGQRLKTELTAQGVNRSDAYWTMAAGVFVARARSYGAMSSYQQAGLTRYTILAVLDEVTTRQCRFMHNRTFSIARALETFDEVDAADDPEDVRYIQPWLRDGKDDEGQYLYVKNRDGSRTTVAREEQSGMGRVDDPGKFKQAMSDADLAKAGVMIPPFHANCRTTVVPDMTSIQPLRRAPAPPKPGKPKPAKPTPEEAPPPPPPLEHRVVAEDEARKLPPHTSKGQDDTMRVLQGARTPDGRADVLRLGLQVDGAFRGSELQPEHWASPVLADVPWDAVVVTERTQTRAQLELAVRRWHGLAASPRGVADPGEFPRIVKYKGKYYVFGDAVTDVAAMRAMGMSALRGHVVDLDAQPSRVREELFMQPRPAPEDAELGEGALRAMAKLPDLARAKTPPQRARALGLKGIQANREGPVVDAMARITDDGIATALKKPIEDRARVGVDELIATSTSDVPATNEEVRAAMRKLARGEHPDIVAVKQDGKLYIVRGAAYVAAAKALGMPRIPITTAEPAARQAGAVPEGIEGFAVLARDGAPEKGDKPRTKEEERALRQAARHALAMVGLTSADGVIARIPGSTPIAPQYGADKLRAGDTGPGAAATHGWDDVVRVKPKYMRLAMHALAKLRPEDVKNPKAALGSLSPDELFGLVLLLHEEAHGASPIMRHAYVDAGVGVEEAMTEMLARRSARALFGVPPDGGDTVNQSALRQPSHYKGQWDIAAASTYRDYQRALLTHAHEALRLANPKIKPEEVPELLERAGARLRGGKPPVPINGPPEHIMRLLEELAPSLSVEERRKLRDKILADPNLMRDKAEAQEEATVVRIAGTKRKAGC